MRGRRWKAYGSCAADRAAAPCPHPAARRRRSIGRSRQSPGPAAPKSTMSPPILRMYGTSPFCTPTSTMRAMTSGTKSSKIASVSLQAGPKNKFFFIEHVVFSHTFNSVNTFALVYHFLRFFQGIRNTNGKGATAKEGRAMQKTDAANIRAALCRCAGCYGRFSADCISAAPFRSYWKMPSTGTIYCTKSRARLFSSAVICLYPEQGFTIETCGPSTGRIKPKKTATRPPDAALHPRGDRGARQL